MIEHGSGQPSTILAIDTSCDDTAAAVTTGWVVRSNIVASQVELHKQYGGVFPTVAKQAHRENIAPTVRYALRVAGVDWDDVDAIAVTQGPGLAPALEVGIAHAQQLAKEKQLPLLPINHLEGHLLSVLAQPRPRSRTTAAIAQRHADTAVTLSSELPTLGMIFSGGHSQFVLVRSIGSYKVLGETVDDAAGEALDKVGRMLGLGYPAGPVIEEFAKQGETDRFEFPLPMTESGDYNLSFSGMKTYSRNFIGQLEADGTLDAQTTYDLCASFQKAVFRHLTHKLTRLLNDLQGTADEPRALWLGGGVSANRQLRRDIRSAARDHARRLRHKGLDARPLTLHTPYKKALCRDNAAMIGVVGAVKYASSPSIPPQTMQRKMEDIERAPRLHL